MVSGKESILCSKKILERIKRKKFFFSDFMTLHSIITDLTEGGAHMDTVNAAGKTPFEAATTGI